MGESSNIPLVGQTLIQNKASSEPRLHALPIVCKEGSSDTLRRFGADPHTTYHSPRPIRSAPPLPVRRRRATAHSGRNHPQKPSPRSPVYPHYPPLSTMVAPRVKPLLRFRAGGTGAQAQPPCS